MCKNLHIEMHAISWLKSMQDRKNPSRLLSVLVNFSTEAGKPKTKTELEKRVLQVVAAYDKVTADKVNVF